MSIWRRHGNHSEKIFASAAAGAKRGPMLSEARSVIVEMNKHLVSRIQHGCQDDFLSPDNPGVKPLDHFVGFDAGAAEYLKAPPDCAQYYARRDMKWPYDVTSGKLVL